jgi:hypothetical protein
MVSVDADLIIHLQGLACPRLHIIQHAATMPKISKTDNSSKEPEKLRNTSQGDPSW